MTFRRLLALFLSIPLAAVAADEPPQWQVQLRTSRHNDFGTLDDLGSEDAARWQARGSRNIAYIDEEVRVQRSSGPWSFALLARQTATLHASRGAVEAFRHAQRIGRDGTDSQWGIDARLRGFIGGGIEAGRRFEIAPEWSGGVQVQALALTRWRDRHIAGSADFRAATTTYGFDLQSTEINDRLKFPFQGDQSVRGAALLFAGEVGWHRGAWMITAGARDLGWLYWNGIPQQDFTLASNTQGVDAEGFVVWRPLLQGRNSQRGLTRRAPPRWHAAARWEATRDGRLTLAAEHVKDFGVLPSIAWTQALGPVQAEVAWRFHERRLELGFGWSGWRVKLGADRLGGDQRSRLVSVGYNRTF